MSTKYILQPNGNILKVSTDAEDDTTDLQSLALHRDGDDAHINRQLEFYKDILTDTKHETPKPGDALDHIDDRNVLQLLDDEAPSLEDSKYLYKSESAPSFGFKSANDGTTTYVPFSSFTRDTMHHPKAFADEFEMLSGYRSQGPDLDFSEGSSMFDLPMFMLTYLVSSIVRFITVEAIVNINHAVMRVTKGYQARAAERYSLRLGKYDYTEFDVFTKYVYNVLNYPHDSSTTVERLIAYFVGFNEWCAPNSAIDLKEITRESTQSKNDLDAITTSISSLGGINKDLILVVSELAVVVYTVLSTLIESLFNETYNNRLKLLSRKFFQEKYWQDELLYKAKQAKSWPDKVFADLNYYYFKFFIERVQVGLKITKKYLYDDTYLKSGTKDDVFNRVSAQRSHIRPDGEGSSLFVDPTFSRRHTAALNKVDDAIASGENVLEAEKELARLNQKYSGPQKNNYSWSPARSDKTRRTGKPAQTTRIRALPQLLTLHEELTYALRENGQKRAGFTRDVSVYQNFYKHDKKRIPSGVVAAVENVLEAEYMPFYFHDVRTNEILSFHAFIESITDSFNPEYNSSSGFGRIDDVRSYIKTTRSINLTFTIAATSSSDHDLMWYQVNKIVSMVYPQWSDGYSAKNVGGGPDFKYPFTQVPTASPLIRLRVGDVIKSNYSRTNLSRLHGIGSNTKQDIKDAKKQGTKNYHELAAGVYRVDTARTFNTGMKTIRLDHSTECMILDDTVDERSGDKHTTTRFYTVEIDDPHDKNNTIMEGLPVMKRKKIKIIADASAIISDQSYFYVEKYLNEDTDAEVDPTEEQKKIMDPDVTPAGVNEDFPSTNNPITRSYESGMSRGLAGFITQLDVNYNEVNWDTTRIGSKAPMLVKITINFAPIHDIPPGLDHNGMMRAPVYNVGRLNNEFFGDPHDKEYVGHGRDKAIEKYKHLLQLSRLS